jgi:hypothetical protein
VSGVPKAWADTRMSSQRNRQRGPNRNSEAGHGEEVQIWQDAINRLRQVVDSVNESSDNVLDIRDQSKKMAELKTNNGKLGALSRCRGALAC